jgi:hypothetical protein
MNERAEREKIQRPIRRNLQAVCHQCLSLIPCPLPLAPCPWPLSLVLARYPLSVVLCPSAHSVWNTPSRSIRR